MNVSLGKKWETFVEAKVNSGDYQTASEVLRDGLRLLEREAWRAQAAESPEARRDAERERVLERVRVGRSGQES